MSIIDRYVLRLFLKVLIVSFVSLAGLFIVIDAFGNLDEFISYGEAEGSLVQALGEYYGAQLLTFFDRTSGLLALIAAMFVVTWLQRTNEMTAIMAGGVPTSRIVKPLFGVVIVVSVLAIANRELLIPRFRDKLTRNAQDLRGESAKPLRPQYDHQSDILIGGRHTIASRREIERPNFRLLTQLGTFGTQLAAESAVYCPPQADRPGGYLLKGVTEPEDLSAHATAVRNERPIIYSPRDTAWLETDQCFVVSDIDFKQLANGDLWRRYSSSWELIKGFRNRSLYYGSAERVEIHSRVVRPLLDVSLLFLGLPLVLTRQQRNVFVAAGLCLAVIVGYFLVVLACQAMGTSGFLSPSLAAWTPLIVFAPLAYTMGKALWE